MWQALRDAVLNAFKTFWDYLIQWAASFNNDFFLTFWPALNGLVTPSLEVFLLYKPYINAWVPIDFGGLLLAVWLSHTLAFSVAKFMIKLIPTIG